MQFHKICFIACLCEVALTIPTKPLRPRFAQPRSRGLQNGLGIVGGTPASIKSLPFMASIFTNVSDVLYFMGSGSIVGKKFILTSAFLVYYKNRSSIYVRVGSDNVAEGGQLIAVHKCIIHEKYDEYLSHDVALLELKKPIKYGKNAKPIKLASKPGKNATSAVVSGYGSTSDPMTDDDFILRKGKQNVISLDACSSTYIMQLDETNSCAYSKTVCPCSYDYGDPLVQKNKLLGYFLGGDFCCHYGFPQIYSSVPSIRKWVKDKMKEAGYDAAEDVGHYYEE